MPGCGWIRANLLGFGCSLQWVYGGLSQFTSQFFPHKFFEGMPTGIYVTQRLEDWNFVGLTLATFQVELLQGIPWERGQTPSRPAAYHKSCDLLLKTHCASPSTLYGKLSGNEGGDWFGGEGSA